jgi:tubulin---tyrosine ligase
VFLPSFIRFLISSRTAAFALSSGTIGAALSSSLSKIRSIALSYGTVLHPTPETLLEPAHVLGGRIARYLWDNWGKDEGGLRDGEVDLYNVNIPLIEGLLDDEGLKICWTRIWRNTYGSLFKPISQPPDRVVPSGSTAVGLDSPNVDFSHMMAPNQIGELVFKFSPNMHGMVNPSPSSLPVGSDAWAFHKGWASVTPFRASFAEPPDEWSSTGDVEGRLWRMKL